MTAKHHPAPLLIIYSAYWHGHASLKYAHFSTQVFSLSRPLSASSLILSPKTRLFQKCTITFRQFLSPNSPKNTPLSKMYFHISPISLIPFPQKLAPSRSLLPLFCYILHSLTCETQNHFYFNAVNAINRVCKSVMRSFAN